MLHHGGRLSAGRQVRRPEFCPNPDCPFTTGSSPGRPLVLSLWLLLILARGKTRRFRCKHCGTTSSTQTFSINYWTHLPINLRDLDDRLNSCAGYRQIARALGVSYPVIKNRTLRLSELSQPLRHLTRQLPLEEDIAFDGIESIFGVSTSLTTSISLSVVPRRCRTRSRSPFVDVDG